MRSGWSPIPRITMIDLFRVLLISAYIVSCHSSFHRSLLPKEYYTIALWLHGVLKKKDENGLGGKHYVAVKRSVRHRYMHLRGRVSETNILE